MLLLNQLIERRKVTARKEKPDSASLGFGKYFTDYMFVMDYEEERGWHDPRITPYELGPSGSFRIGFPLRAGRI